MKIHYDHATTAVSRIHAFQLEIGHGEWTENVDVRVREYSIGAPKRFELADALHPELLEMLQMSSDELLLKLTEELKGQ